MKDTAIEAAVVAREGLASLTDEDWKTAAAALKQQKASGLSMVQWLVKWQR